MALILILLAWMGWQIVGNTAADTNAASDPEAALAWRSDLPAALVVEAEERLVAAETDADLAAVADLAHRALLAAPLEESALRLIGLVGDLQGQTRQADAVMNVAGRRTLRDAVTQLWLYNQNVRREDFGAALANTDAVLRTRDDLYDRLLPALAGVASDPAGQKALVALLGADPPWRDWFLGALPGATASATAYAILTGLEATPSPPSDREIRPYLNRLIDGGAFQLAYLAWLNFLPPERSRTVSYLYNGDFALPPTGLAFDWVIDGVGGASTQVVDTGEAEHGRALRVTFANNRVAYRHTSKLMLLPPGAYAFSGLARAENLNNERGLVWRISCADGDKQRLAESPRILGTFPWHRFDVAFAVPAIGCSAQVLRLELDARVALEQQIGGEVWFDDLAVDRRGSVAVGEASPR